MARGWYIQLEISLKVINTPAPADPISLQMFVHYISILLQNSVHWPRFLQKYVVSMVTLSLAWTQVLSCTTTFIDHHTYKIWPQLVKCCWSSLLHKVLVKSVVTMATLCLTITEKMFSTSIPQCHHVHQIWFQLLHNFWSSSLYKVFAKICSYHGNALPNKHKIHMLYICTSMSSYAPDFFSFAWKLWL